MSPTLEIFTPEDIQWLAAHRWLAGAEVYREIDSTNRRAIECGETIASPHLVVAETQTAGRGRGANRWWGQTGCLMFSLTLDTRALAVPKSQLGILSLATGLAVWETLAEFVHAVDLKLKWPNDVYLCNRKVCGILLEMTGGAASSTVVIGVGLNVHNQFHDAPDEVRQRATSLAEHLDHPPCLRDVLERLLDGIQTECERVAEKRLDLQARWSRCCYLRGKDVEIKQPHAIIRGVCEGIEAGGGLLVRTPHQLQVVQSGEVLIG